MITMPVLADCHLHSSFSGDSEAPMNAMVQQAIAKGLKTICFTEHNDFHFPGENPHQFELNPDSYLYDLLRAREKYQDQIEILFGVEIGLQEEAAPLNMQLANGYDFDFIIGSLHIINRKDPYYPAYFEGRSDEDAYREYFECTLENLKAFSNYDSLGHLDYIVRYGKTKDADYSYTKYADYIDPILKLLIEQEKALEINTAGLRYGLRETNPCLDIVKRYHELGGELITIGSDAHKPEDVGYALDKAGELLKACGFNAYTIFSHRKPEQRLL